MPDDRTMGDVKGAMAYLRTLPYLNGKIGIIGYCSGGRQVYLAACTLPGIDAAVDCLRRGVIARPEELTKRQPVAPIEYTKDLRCPYSDCLERKINALAGGCGEKRKENSKGGGRNTSSISMIMQVTLFSRWIVQTTVRKLR